ncbi:MAG: ECF transporter S component [Clostridia bacterium]|nr:ECF transporter S component [Clostridia bacterium]
MTTTKTKKLVLAAICLALCIVLPLIFHAVPNGGSIFLPMHIPVLICGLMCGGIYGAVCGALGPLLSSLITGMPPLSMAPAMMVECMVYGLTCGILMKYVKTGKNIIDIYVCLTVAMLLGRVIAGFAKALIFTPGVSPFAWVVTSLVTGIPGIVIQLILIPLLIASLTKAGLLEKRYE